MLIQFVSISVEESWIRGINHLYNRVVFQLNSIQVFLSCDNVCFVKLIILLNMNVLETPTKQAKWKSGREPKIHQVTEVKKTDSGGNKFSSGQINFPGCITGQICGLKWFNFVHPAFSGWRLGFDTPALCNSAANGHLDYCFVPS